MKTRLNNVSQKPFNISHSFWLMISLTQSRYCGGYRLVDLRNGVVFCEGSGVFFSSTVLSTPYYGASQIKNWDMKSLYSREVGD